MEIVSVIVAWMALILLWGCGITCLIWWKHNPTYGAPARIHLNGWPRLRRRLDVRPMRKLTIQITCAYCGAGPMEPCDAGLHS